MSSSNSTLAGRGSHQLVSEPLPQPWPYPTPPSPPPQPLDLLLEGSRQGSSGHGESGGTTTARGRASSIEDRILSLETTVGIWSGTILDLSGKVDRLLDLSGKVDRVLDLSDRFVRMEKLIEEMANSKKNGEFMAQNPSLQFNQTPPVMHQSNFRSLMSVPEQTPEERIRFLRAIAHKYKGDLKSPEERLQILTAAAQKYKARRDSQAVEEQFQKPNDDLLSVPSTFPNPLATGHQQVPPQVHEEEDPIVQSVYTNSQLQINPKPPVISTTMSPNEINSVGMVTPQRGNRSMAIGMGSNGPGMYTTAPRVPVMALVTLPSHASLVVGQFLDDECPEDSIKGLIPSVCSLVPVKALVDEGISFQVLVWDPGIQVRFSSTLRQGRFEGEGMIRTLLLIPVLGGSVFSYWGILQHCYRSHSHIIANLDNNIIASSAEKLHITASSAMCR